jgi:hypothetical protein
LIDNTTSKEAVIAKGINKVRDTFIPTVSDYFLTEKQVTPKQIKRLSMPVNVDLFGKNEIPVIAQFIDMERHYNHIKTDYYDLKQLQEAIGENKSFLVSAEPDKIKFPICHDVWSTLRKSKSLEYVDSSEVERIREYAVAHAVKPFSLSVSKK